MFDLLQLPFTDCYRTSIRRQYVAVLGGGTIGIFTMQWAKIFGSRKVVVFDISESVWNWQTSGCRCSHQYNERKLYAGSKWHLPGKRDMAMCSRRQDRSRLCIWHLNLRAIKQMSVYRNTTCRAYIHTGNVGEYEPERFHLTGSWMSYSARFRKKSGADRTLFCNRTVKIRSGIYLQKVPMSQHRRHFRCSRRRDWSKEKCYL